jgi:hypothetical protein
VYTRLSERLGLSDHLLVLNVMLAKIATNLKVYGACDDVVTPTLALFQVRTFLYALFSLFWPRKDRDPRHPLLGRHLLAS